VNRVAPRSVLAAWQLAREQALDVFKPGVAAALSALRGWASLGLPSGTDTDPCVTVLDALRALALAERQQAPETRAELVTTMPLEDRTILETANVVRALVEGAKEDLLVVGYDIRELAFRRMLVRRGIAGVQVRVVGDRRMGGARELLRDWSATARPLIALENVEPAATVPDKLHGKVIVADRTVALVSSANFTAGGLRNNIEFGIRVSGPPVRDILRCVDQLEKRGWLIPAVP
jgi:phosphatidylserine/phosphatidylglycerophosphate/cardiolipin synthase-like enzyme